MAHAIHVVLFSGRLQRSCEGILCSVFRRHYNPEYFTSGESPKDILLVILIFLSIFWDSFEYGRIREGGERKKPANHCARLAGFLFGFSYSQ
jgi:hypothetical protein